LLMYRHRGRGGTRHISALHAATWVEGGQQHR